MYNKKNDSFSKKEIYDEIKQISKTEGRTISGQLRLVFDVYKKNVKKDELYMDRG